MKLQIVCLRDVKTDTHTTPQFVHHIESWRRALSDAINKPDQNTKDLDFVKHPEDFEAYHLGNWEDSNAEFGSPTNDKATIDVSQKIRICHLADLVTPK